MRRPPLLFAPTATPRYRRNSPKHYAGDLSCRWSHPQVCPLAVPPQHGSTERPPLTSFRSISSISCRVRRPSELCSPLLLLLLLAVLVAAKTAGPPSAEGSWVGLLLLLLLPMPTLVVGGAGALLAPSNAVLLAAPPPAAARLASCRADRGWPRCAWAQPV